MNNLRRVLLSDFLSMQQDPWIISGTQYPDLGIDHLVKLSHMTWQEALVSNMRKKHSCLLHSRFGEAEILSVWVASLITLDKRRSKT